MDGMSEGAGGASVVELVGRVSWRGPGVMIDVRLFDGSRQGVWQACDAGTGRQTRG